MILFSFELQINFNYFLLGSVHLKIHVPDVVHKHKHLKTKYVHVYHPKVVHSDHGSSVEFLHSRRDPNVDIVNGGYPQTLINLNRNPELRISEDDFNKWRQEQLRKAWEKKRKAQYDDDDAGYERDDEAELEDEDEDEDETLHKKHRFTRVNSPPGRKESSKHKNHNYQQDYEATNADQAYAKYPSRHANKKQKFKPSVQVEHPASERKRKTKPKNHGSYQHYTHHDAEASNLQPQIAEETYPTPQPQKSQQPPQKVPGPTQFDPHHKLPGPTQFGSAQFDPTYYSTIPRDQETQPSKQDEIYSGLIAADFDKKTASKTKMLADMNYLRKKQTKAASTAQTKTNQ